MKGNCVQSAKSSVFIAVKCTYVRVHSDVAIGEIGDTSCITDMHTRRNRIFKRHCKKLQVSVCAMRWSAVKNQNGSLNTV